MSLPIGLDQITVTIAISTSLSAEIGTGAKTIVGIAMPASGWDSAVLSFQVSVDGGKTWLELYDTTGTEVSFVAAAGQYIQVDPVLFAGINDIKVRSGTSASAVTQTAARTLTLVCRQV